MKPLQNKHFWRRKRAVLENQLFHVENRIQVATFFPRSGASLVVVSAKSEARRKPDAVALGNYLNRFQYD